MHGCLVADSFYHAFKDNAASKDVLLVGFVYIRFFCYCFIVITSAKKVIMFNSRFKEVYQTMSVLTSSWF